MAFLNPPGSPGLMKKTRPQLTVLATDHKATSDEEDDELEASCQIGETTLRKANLRINRSGVRFVSDSADFKLRQQEDEDVSAFTSAKSIRNLVTLDELETCGLVGRGSSGQVFKARHRDSHTLLYAVKVVTNVFDKPRRDQLLTEIRTLYDIESPYLVGFYGAFFHDHALSLVLEFCALGSLDQVLRTLPDAVPERIVASIAVQVLTGLQHLKRTHHFHRDVKPQNILMQQDGAVKLTDFGLARELGSTISMAQTFVGTFKYMAPERVQNERYDYKSDVWSLGLVLIECATRAFPYANAKSYIDVVQSIVESPEPQLPTTDTQGAPFTREFHAFIGRCLKKEPAERASVEELLASPWLQLHEATDPERCVRRCGAWLRRHHLVVSDDHLDAKQCEDEEEEIEEAIETAEDSD